MYRQLKPWNVWWSTSVWGGSIEQVFMNLTSFRKTRNVVGPCQVYVAVCPLTLLRYVMLCYAMLCGARIMPDRLILVCYVIWYYTIEYNFIAKCQYNCTRNVLWCQVHSSHIYAKHETLLNYSKNNNNSKHWGLPKQSLINKYMRNSTDIKAAHIKITSLRGLLHEEKILS